MSYTGGTPEASARWAGSGGGGPATSWIRVGISSGAWLKPYLLLAHRGIEPIAPTPDAWARAGLGTQIPAPQRETLALLADALELNDLTLWLAPPKSARPEFAMLHFT
jgi:hypothetical protein